MYSYNPYYYEFLAHHGVKGQKWGIRRYQPYTSANKGVFKNLRRSYKSSVRQIKKARRQYEQEGDELAVAAANKAIKDTKKSYKSELKGLKKEFKAENRANYLQDVAERGNEKQVNKVRKELSPDQLNTAIRRIQAYKDWEKLSLRDVEKEVQYENSMKRLDKIMKGADTVSRVATATINVTSAAKSFKDFFKKPSEHDKLMNQYAEDKAKIDVDMAKARLKGQEISNYQKVLDYKNKNKSETPKTELPKSTDTSKSSGSDKNETSKTAIPKSQSTTSSNYGSKSSQYYTSSDPAYAKLSKAAQNGVKAYEKAKAAGKDEKAAENARRQAIIKSQTDAVRVPVSVARQGNMSAYKYIVDNYRSYEDKTVNEAYDELIKHARSQGK
jgi:hypothetical protein